MKFDWFTLTQAEREIIQLLAEGLTNQQIAKLRNTTHSTVKNQVYELTHKLAMNRTRIVALAVAGGHITIAEQS